MYRLGDTSGCVMGRSNNSRRRRDNFSISNRRLPTQSIVPVAYDPWDTGYVTEVSYSKPARRRSSLRLVEDRRQWHPVGPQMPARAWNRNATRVIVPRYAKLAGTAVTAKLAFSGPSSVAICVRRKRRREIMFAKGFGGRRGQRRPKRNWYSSIRCRR